jgi:hypothetical protein
MQKFEGPLFILGMPRSGTKLIRQLLNQHPRIHIPPGETEFFPWLVTYARKHGDLSLRPNFLAFFETVQSFPFFIHLPDHGKSISPNDWFDRCKTYDAAGIFEGLIRCIESVKTGSGEIWGDKSPSYISHVPLLRLHFPEARFIHIVRDVRDYCLSINKAWKKNMLRAAQRWADCVHVARAQGSMLGDSYIEIHYEELLRNPDFELRRVCDFLGVDFTETLLRIPKSAENYGDAKGEARIVTENLDKYKKGLEPKLLKRIEGIAGDVLLECGYRLSIVPHVPRRLNKLEMIIGQGADAVNLVRFNLERRGSLGAIAFVLRSFWTSRNL